MTVVQIIDEPVITLTVKPRPIKNRGLYSKEEVGVLMKRVGEVRNDIVDLADSLTYRGFDSAYIKKYIKQCESELQIAKMHCEDGAHTKAAFHALNARQHLYRALIESRF
jgi:hypothetical protein